MMNMLSVLQPSESFIEGQPASQAMPTSDFLEVLERFQKGPPDPNLPGLNPTEPEVLPVAMDSQEGGESKKIDENKVLVNMGVDGASDEAWVGAPQISPHKKSVALSLNAESTGMAPLSVGLESGFHSESEPASLQPRRLEEARSQTALELFGKKNPVNLPRNPMVLEEPRKNVVAFEQPQNLSSRKSDAFDNFLQIPSEKFDISKKMDHRLGSAHEQSEVTKVQESVVIDDELLAPQLRRSLSQNGLSSPKVVSDGLGSKALADGLSVTPWQTSSRSEASELHQIGGRVLDSLGALEHTLQNMNVGTVDEAALAKSSELAGLKTPLATVRPWAQGGVAEKTFDNSVLVKSAGISGYGLSPKGNRSGLFNDKLEAPILAPLGWGANPESINDSSSLEGLLSKVQHEELAFADSSAKLNGSEVYGELESDVVKTPDTLGNGYIQEPLSSEGAMDRETLGTRQNQPLVALSGFSSKALRSSAQEGDRSEMEPNDLGVDNSVIQQEAFSVTRSSIPRLDETASSPVESMNVEQVIEESQVLIENGGGRLKVALQPQHLGNVELEVSTIGDQVQVKIIVESPEAKREIEHAFADLHESLADRSLKLDSLEVVQSEAKDMNTHREWTFQERSTAWQNQESQQKQGQSGRNSFGENLVGEEQVHGEPATPQARSGDHRYWVA